MDGAAESRLERSSHTAFIENNTLYVWGGYQVRDHTVTVGFTCAGVSVFKVSVTCLELPVSSNIYLMCFF